VRLCAHRQGVHERCTHVTYVRMSACYRDSCFQSQCVPADVCHRQVTVVGNVCIYTRMDSVSGMICEMPAGRSSDNSRGHRGNVCVYVHPCEWHDIGHAGAVTTAKTREL
jgi:hypothetical protein